MLKIRHEFPEAFRRLGVCFRDHKLTGVREVDALLEQLRSPEVVLPGKKKPVGAPLHAELQLLKDALLEVSDE
jgi:hypothetical protein